MCFPAVVFLLTSWSSRGRGEPWLLALGHCWDRQELTWDVLPQESQLPACMALNLADLPWSYGCLVVRHCSINPCVFPCEELGSCQKFTTEIFQFKLLKALYLCFHRAFLQKIFGNCNSSIIICFDNTAIQKPKKFQIPHYVSKGKLVFAKHKQVSAFVFVL